MATRPYVYILILNYNSEQDTIELYNQLQRIDYQNYSILVIDNDSNHTSKTTLKKSIPPSDLILNKKNIGYAGGNNIGIRKAISASADYVWILNPDIRVETKTLNILVEHITEDKKIAAVGPRICMRDNKEIIFSDGGVVDTDNGIQTYHLKFKQNIKEIKESNKTNKVDYIDGSCLFIDINCLKEIGFLNEKFFLYFEETEWCLRARNLGWESLVVLSTTCYNLTSSRNFKYFFYMARNRVYLSYLMNNKTFKTILLELYSIISSRDPKVILPKISGIMCALFLFFNLTHIFKKQ